MNDIDDIKTHEDIQNVSFLSFIQKAWNDSIGAGRIASDRSFPDPDADTVNTVAARIVWNRWIVDCITCNSATICSRVTLRFICPDCGSPENDYQWYAITYPENWKEIHAVLLERPKPLAGNYASPSRNWDPSESVAELKAENDKQGNLRKVERTILKGES